MVHHLGVRGSARGLALQMRCISTVEPVGRQADKRRLKEEYLGRDVVGVTEAGKLKQVERIHSFIYLFNAFPAVDMNSRAPTLAA